MALPDFSMRQLLEAGVHFGHNTRRWNPRMAEYLYGVRSDIHIIDLRQTAPMLNAAMRAVRDTVAGGGRVLFVGTKRQAQTRIAEAAARCGQFYVNHRWLGGMLTNWRTISQSIKRLKDLEKRLETSDGAGGLTKKELLNLTREHDKLEKAIGGIKEMGGLPDILVVIDTDKEYIAVAEANKLGIPVVGVIDSNADPTGIDYPVPGNDDSIRAIKLYCDLMEGAVLDGISVEMSAGGIDPGARETAAETIEPAVLDSAGTEPKPEPEPEAEAGTEADEAAGAPEAEAKPEPEAAPGAAPEAASGAAPGAEFASGSDAGAEANAKTESENPAPA